MSEVAGSKPANAAGPRQLIEMEKAALRLQRLLQEPGTSLAGISPEASLELAEIIAAGYARRVAGPDA